MRASFFQVLRSTAAISVVALGATAANADCTTANDVVTCTDINTTDQVNTQVNSAPPPSVTLVIAQGATVTRGSSSVLNPNSIRFPGAVGYINSGIVGENLANVDFRYNGTTSFFNGVANPSNTFTVTNNGTQNGGIFAFNVGGAISGANNGTVTGGIDLRGAEAISFNNTGSVSNDRTFGGGTAVSLISSLGTFLTGTDRVIRQTEVGGMIVATINGTIGITTGSSASFQPQGIDAQSVGGVDLMVNGRAGVVVASSFGTSAERFSGFTSTNGTSTDIRSDDERSIGTDARVTIGAAGRVTVISVGSPRSATAIVNGTVDGKGFGPSVSVSSGARERSFRSSEVRTSNPFSLDSSFSEFERGSGGTALVDISSTARVVGGVGAFSNAGAATVRIAGIVEAAGSTVSASSSGVNSTRQGRSNVGPDGSSEGSSTFTQSLSGGAALVSIASTGNISFGSVNVDGDTSATIDNAGRIGFNVSATSGELLETARVSSSARTTAITAGTQTDITRFASNITTEMLGGTALLNNRVNATVQGSVQASGARGATLDNAGSIAGSVFLTSQGTQTVVNSNDLFTNTTTPATGNAATTAIVREMSSTTTSRATGGAVTGAYSGTVGVARTGTAPGTFVSVTQNGNTASTATVTGTLFANFFGTAGSQNGDASSNSTSRQVTQSSGASTSDESNSSSDTVTQNASASSLTVGAIGVISNAGGAAGAVTLNSLGGNADFTLNGGAVDGRVNINAGSGFNTVQSSSASSSFTRAAPTGGVFAPDMQQSQRNTSASDQRVAIGTATATINGGTIGGNLNVAGTGSGTGTLGASALINGNVTGNVFVRANRNDTRNTGDDVFTQTGANAVARTLTTSLTTAPAANGGNVLVTVNGNVGSFVDATAGAGSATLNLNGRAGTVTSDGVFANAFAFTRQTDTVQNFAGTSFFSTQATSSRSVVSSVAGGGTATINIAANADVRGAGASSVEGNVVARGLTGSILNIAAGARTSQTAGNVFAGVNFVNSTITTDNNFTGGVPTGSTSINVATVTGGASTINNAGVIGSAANQAVVQATSITNSAVNNTGTINGAANAIAVSANSVTSTTDTNQNIAADARTVTTRAQTAVGGVAQVNNSGLITGEVNLFGATGNVTNTGVMRAGVTLGAGASNFTTTTTTMVAGTTTAPSVSNPVLFTQNYTLNQNGLLLGGVIVTGATTVDPSGATVRTSDVNATINLNSGSTTLGNIVADANTVADVNLNGAGFLGVAAGDAPAAPTLGIAATGFQPTSSFARFSGLDPSLGTTTVLTSGSRVTGVRNLTKSGDGTFVIVGAPFVAAAGTTPATYTLDIGTLRVNDGELQLGTAGNTGIFGMRGSLENNAGLVLGRRIINGTQTAIQGIDMAVLGNFTNAAAGNLFVGTNPTFVRNTALSSFTPLVLGSPFLASTNSFARVDGNLTLAGTVTVQGISGGLYESGRLYDLFSVSGAYANTGTVRSSFASPFVRFVLTPRSEGGRTIVSMNVARTNFDTVATDRNARNAAGALQATLPGIFAGLRTAGGGGASNQDFANIVAALDTQFTADQAAQVFRELSSGEFYGSVSAISTTAPFGDATDGLPTGGTGSGVGLWFRPTAQFARYRRNEDTGAAAIGGENYGGSVGLNFATGNGGHIGIAGGYGKLDIDSEATEGAEAETYMVGIYGVQQLARLHVSAQAVYGKSKWDAVRALPTLARVATSSFDSDEIRATLRVAYTIAPLPGLDISPFAKIEARRYEFDGFEETGANAVSLVVGKRSKTVITPEAGFRISGSMSATLRPFAEASYIFQQDVGSDRRLSFVGNRPQEFTVQGVEPRDAIKGTIGVAADIGRGTVFVRGDYSSGGDQQVGSVRGGLLFSF